MALVRQPVMDPDYVSVADFVAGIESGKPAQPDFRNALETQKVCDAVIESAQRGQWIETGVQL